MDFAIVVRFVGLSLCVYGFFLGLFLGEGGVYNQCGWLDDKFGISWQIVPSILGKLMSDPSKATRVVQAFMKMTKFDIEKLVNA